MKLKSDVLKKWDDDETVAAPRDARDRVHIAVGLRWQWLFGVAISAVGICAGSATAFAAPICAATATATCAATTCAAAAAAGERTSHRLRL